MNANEFLTHLARPWDRLNGLLRHPYAFQPELNDPLRDAATIAVFIRHIPENDGIDQNVAQAESSEHDILIDVGDAWKHGSLRDASRDNELSIGSRFEVVGEDKFRFIRNVITVKHATKGTHDLMQIEGAAIAYWRQKLGVASQWIPLVKEAEPAFSSKAVLFFNPAHQVEMKNLRLEFVRRREDGELVPSNTAFEFHLHRIGA